jgi:hypothetical protein
MQSWGFEVDRECVHDEFYNSERQYNLGRLKASFPSFSQPFLELSVANILKDVRLILTQLAIFTKPDTVSHASDFSAAIFRTIFSSISIPDHSSWEYQVTFDLDLKYLFIHNIR